MPDLPALIVMEPQVMEDVVEVIDPAAIAGSIPCEADCTILRVSSPLLEGHRDDYYRSLEGLVYSEDQDGGNIVEPAPAPASFSRRACASASTRSPRRSGLRNTCRTGASRPRPATGAFVDGAPPPTSTATPVPSE